MKIDSFTNSFEIAKQYQGVVQQQGRVQQDQDWNSQGDVQSCGIAHMRDEFVSLSAGTDPTTSTSDPEWKYVPIRRLTR